MEDIVGKRFGRLVVQSRGENDRTRAIRFNCICDCGSKKLIHKASLIRGATRSCGCIRKEMLAVRSKTHGHTANGKSSKVYRIWAQMIQRCTTPTDKKFHAYGARGISVCDRWRESFQDFLADMGERPEGMSIDRIDNNGNYEPGNCRWATNMQQSRNTRQNKFIVVDGERMCLVDAAKAVGVCRNTMAAWVKQGKYLLVPYSEVANVA